MTRNQAKKYYVAIARALGYTTDEGKAYFKRHVDWFVESARQADRVTPRHELAARFLDRMAMGLTVDTIVDEEPEPGPDFVDRVEPTRKHKIDCTAVASMYRTFRRTEALAELGDVVSYTYR